MKKFFLDKIAATSPSFLPKTKKEKKKKKNLRFVNTKMMIFVQILNEILSAREINTDRSQVHGTAINQIVVLLTLKRSRCSIIL